MRMLTNYNCTESAISTRALVLVFFVLVIVVCVYGYFGGDLG